MIVVDDGSADPAALRAVVEAAGARVLRHDRPRGPAAARNAGLAAATTPLVAFLDSDVLPTSGWLAPLLAHLADPAVALVAPRIVALPPVRGWLARYEAVRSSLDLGPDPAAVVPRSRVAYVPSAALLVRRAALGAGFDERMYVAEDVDLVLRLPRRRLAAALRAGGPRGARAPHRPTRLVAAQGLLRQRGGAARAAASRCGPAAGVIALVGRPRRVAARPPPAGGGRVAAAATERLARQLRGLAHPRRAAARIIGLGAVGAVAQTVDGLTRHYWPLTALACAVSRRARRFVAAVALTEGLVDWHRHRSRDARVRPGPVGHVVAHRLDDLAYGAGLWWGAAAHRTLAPLRPAGPRFAAAGAVRRGSPRGVAPQRAPSESIAPNG